MPQSVWFLGLILNILDLVRGSVVESGPGMDPNGGES
jgi:hypothetical protein